MRSRVIGLFIGLSLGGCAAIAVSPAQLTRPPPTDVRIVSAPDNGPDLSVAVPTWVLALVTAGLCIITARIAKAALADASRLRRESLQREVNTAAHKVAATAERVGQLAASVPKEGGRLSGIKTSGKSETASPAIQAAAHDRASRTRVMKDHALQVITSPPTDSDQLASAQRRLDEHLVQLDVMKEAISAELDSVARDIASAEQTQRRLTIEVGHCNKLIFVLGQMLTALESIQMALFEEPATKRGRPPEWSEIGALVGAPIDTPGFTLDEYAFLLQDEDPSDLAPELLGRIYHAEANYRHLLSRLNDRSQLWHQYNEIRATPQFLRGEAALAEIGTTTALTARLKELTRWLAEDLPESIQTFKTLFQPLYAVLNAKYPGKRFIKLWPTNDPTAPHL